MDRTSVIRPRNFYVLHRIGNGEMRGVRMASLLSPDQDLQGSDPSSGLLARQNANRYPGFIQGTTRVGLRWMMLGEAVLFPKSLLLHFLCESHES
jgi:hypothetical protein